MFHLQPQLWFIYICSVYGNVTVFPFGSGIRIFDDKVKSTDAAEAGAFHHKLGMIDIFSNSWGPGDVGWEIKGPGRLASKAIKRGIEQVFIF